MEKLASLSNLEDGLNNVIDKVKAENYAKSGEGDLTAITGVLKGGGWTSLDGLVYTQTMSAQGVKANDIVLVGLGTMTMVNRDIAIKAKIACISQSENTLGFEASDCPEIDIPIVVVKQGVAAS